MAGYLLRIVTLLMIAAQWPIWNSDKTRSVNYIVQMMELHNLQLFRQAIVRKENEQKQELCRREFAVETLDEWEFNEDRWILILCRHT